jgi:hypothetical protein
VGPPALGLPLTRKKDSSFSEEKEAKRLLSIWNRVYGGHISPRQLTKVFCFFFSKKKVFLAYDHATLRLTA